MIVWSLWPWLCGWMFPGHHALAWMPAILLAPFIYPGVIAFMAILPGWAAFPVGLTVTLFCLAYLAIVTWRCVAFLEMKLKRSRQLPHAWMYSGPAS